MPDRSGTGADSGSDTDATFAAVEEGSCEPRQDRACCIVGIGASAGGLETLQRFFDAVPGDSDLAYVVVQHLSPVHKSLMVDLLAKHTAMDVVQASDGVPVERNTVYLLPPGKHLSIQDGRLLLTAKDAGSGMSLPIDIFFTALANDQGPLAMGVILSGTGSDGTRGLLAIKSAGGFAGVQTPETAQFDGMPRSAIATGQVDIALPPDALPAKLIEHARRTLARTRTAPSSSGATAPPTRWRRSSRRSVRSPASISRTTSWQPCCGGSNGGCMPPAWSRWRSTPACCGATAPKRSACTRRC